MLKQYPIRKFITRGSKNVTYALECTCRYQYIGRTSRTLTKCISEHITNIQNGYPKHSVSNHFRVAHNRNPAELTFYAIDMKISFNWIRYPQGYKIPIPQMMELEHPDGNTLIGWNTARLDHVITTTFLPMKFPGTVPNWKSQNLTNAGRDILSTYAAHTGYQNTGTKACECIHFKPFFS